MARTRHTLVLSDVHLAEAEPGEGPWMRYRQRRWFPDDDFRAMIDRVLAAVGARDELDLVFGGDLIEFEGPYVIDGETRFVDPPRTEGEAIATLDRIVRDHPTFFDAIADVLRAGHRVVFVIGNHDVQLTFPGVQRALRGHLEARVHPPAGLDDRVLFRPWFFQTGDGIHVEHGHQYDTYCSFRDPLRPLAHWGDEIHPTVGSVAFRHLVSRMGYFNAYDERSYMLSAPRYFAHWARHYLFSNHSLVATWFLGGVRVVKIVLASRPARRILEALRHEARLARAAFARMHAVDPSAVEEHASLFAAPADEDPHLVVRELRLDHAVMAGVGLVGLVTSAFKPRLGMALALGALGAGIAQALLRPRQSVEDQFARVQRIASDVARIYRARAVVFGHTHIPVAEVDDGVFIANTGAWTPDAPGADDPEDAPKPSRGRPVVWIRRDADKESPLEGGLYRFRDGALAPTRVLGPDPEPEPEPEPEPDLFPTTA